MPRNLLEMINSQSSRLTKGARVLQKYMSQIFSGLAYMHSKGIVHRDIKLSNVCSKGTLKGKKAASRG